MSTRAIESLPLLEQAVEDQKNLFIPIVGSEGLDKRFRLAKYGHLPKALTLEDTLSTSQTEWVEKLFGESASRIVALTVPKNGSTLIPEQLAVAGGWCALRIADSSKLGEGIMINPITANPEEIKSVNQVAEWIKRSPSLDQAIEAIGPTRSAEMFAISERQLWTNRIVAKTMAILNRQLTIDEKDILEAAVDQAELDRLRMSNNYSKLLFGSDASVIQRVVDADIWEELKEARNILLARCGLSLESISKSTGSDLAGLSERGLVWAMYSQPYFESLKRKGIISQNVQKFLVVEPVLHSSGTCVADNMVVERAYQDRGIYFDQRGFNDKTGFVAFIEALDERGKSIRTSQSVGTVPNLSNWETMFTTEFPESAVSGQLLPTANRTLTLSQNKLFLWGVNLMPFGQTAKILNQMIELGQRFKQDKERTIGTFSIESGKQDGSRSLIQSKIQNLREEKLIELDELNGHLCDTLFLAMRFLFEGGRS